MRKRVVLSIFACWAALLVTIACGSSADTSRGTPARAAAQAEHALPSTAVEPAEHVEHGARSRVVILGDSLTAGLGLEPAQAYPALLQEFVDGAGLRFEVVNAGVSGDTSAGGLRRLDWSIDDGARVLIVALGANDGLRGLSVDDLERNLSRIIEVAQSKHITVVLAGMEAPPNLGKTYTDAFRHVYPFLATKYHVTLVPFLLDGVAGIDTMNQSDGLHPTAEGSRTVAANVWRVLEPVLREQSTH